MTLVDVDSRGMVKNETNSSIPWPDPVSYPPRRAVLLGASNLVRSLSTVVDTAQRVWGSPLDFVAAIGHGRSYGRQSRVLMRSLPGITTCGLWSELASRPPASTAALITDIGNDLLYGASPHQIVEWVEQCLQRVSVMTSCIVITELPLESLAQVGPSRFLLMRAVLFPKSRLRYHEALDRARQLNCGVAALADRYHAQRVTPRREWFGFDPIHVRRRYREKAWRTMLLPWRVAGLSPERGLSSFDRWKLLRLRPHRRRWFGVEQHQAQPAGVLSDGSLVSLF